MGLGDGKGGMAVGAGGPGRGPGYRASSLLSSTSASSCCFLRRASSALRCCFRRKAARFLASSSSAFCSSYKQAARVIPQDTAPDTRTPRQHASPR